MNRDHNTELEKIGPQLAKLKAQLHQEDVTQEYTDALYQKIKPHSAPVISIGFRRIITIAASLAVLISMILVLNNQLAPTIEEGIYESYVSDNWEEFEDIIDDEISPPTTWLEEELTDIPESEIISYLESNLDALDLELLY